MNNPDVIKSTEDVAGCSLQQAGSASLSDAEITDLKLRINQIIWEYAPAETTIGNAEDMACKILNSVRRGKYLI